MNQPSVERSWVLGVAAVAAVGFLAIELTTSDPFIDMRVLARSGRLLSVYLQMFLSAVITYSFIFGFTQWLEGGLGLNPALAGLVLLPSFASGLLVAAVTGRSSRFRSKLALAGMAQIVGLALLLFVSERSPWGYLVPISIVMGIPQGLVNVGTQSAVYQLAHPNSLGASAGLLRAFMYLGAIASAALGGIAFSAGHSSAQLHVLVTFVLAPAALFATLLPTLRGRSR
jgi:hypothetical protein